MSLKINGRTLHALPLRFRGSTGFEYAETTKASQRNIFAGQGITDKASGNPAGHLYPSAWIWPQKPGSITAFKTTFGSSTAIATLAAGIGISGALAGTSSATATALGIAVIEGAISATAATSATGATNALISGSTQGTSTATATLAARTTAFLEASTAGNAEVSGAIGALYFLTAASAGGSAASATITAKALLSGSVTPFTELSPQNLAREVWAATLEDNAGAGTMGESLKKTLKKTQFLALK